MRERMTFETVLERMANIHEAKNADYGNIRQTDFCVCQVMLLGMHSKRVPSRANF
jgi:hypothetical protein